MRYLLILLCLCSCGEITSTPVIPEKPPALEDTRISALEARLAKATEEKDEIARLSVLRDMAAEKLRQNEAENTVLKAQLKGATTAITDERTSQAQTKAYWFVGIMGVAALAFAALAIFVPSTVRWAVKAAIAAGVVSALAIVFAWLIPYLFWIGLAIIATAAILAVIYWRLDAKSRDQVVTAFEGIKDKVPGYKDHFNKVIDTDADKWLDKTRKRLKLKKA